MAMSKTCLLSRTGSRRPFSISCHIPRSITHQIKFQNQALGLRGRGLHTVQMRDTLFPKTSAGDTAQYRPMNGGGGLHAAETDKTNGGWDLSSRMQRADCFWRRVIAVA